MAIGELAPGSLFASDYRIVRPLAAGGMGAVYIVDQISTAKSRALKLMHPELVANADLRRRFEQEARIGAQIDSEHIVEVQAAGVDSQTGMPYLVMELLDGEDLATTVKRRGALSPTEVGAIYVQLCHAVGAAHAAGIVHRDLKPENIFLGRSRRAGVAFTVKVLDFGIAKLLAEGQTKHTEAMGSPIWLAPEQTERGLVTPAADVWALGLIAFHLMTGAYYWRSLYDGDATVPQLLREIIFEPLPPASERGHRLGRSLSPAFDAWFAQCVSRDPTARFANATLALEALVPVLTNHAPVSGGPAVVQGVAHVPTVLGPPAYEPPRPPGPASYGPPPYGPAYGPPPSPQRAAQPYGGYAPMMLAPPRHPLSNATPIASANTSPSAKARGPHWTLWGAMGLGVCLVLAVLAGFATSGPADVSSPTSYDIAVQTYGKYMSSAPTLSSADVAGALRKQDFSACARTSDVDASHDSSAVWISVKLVIVKGRVAGATAVVDPGADSKLDIARVGTCVEQVLGNMTQAWQSNEVGKYEVWFVARRGTIDWPGY